MHRTSKRYLFLLFTRYQTINLAFLKNLDLDLDLQLYLLLVLTNRKCY